MMSAANEKIIPGVLNKLKLFFDELMLKCQPLGYDDYLSKTKFTKLSVVSDKLKFDARVNELIDSAESCTSVILNLEKQNKK